MKSIKDEFLEILSNYQGIIHKVCLIYFRNKQEREDNFQEIVYQLWKSYPKLKNKNSIASWIYSVSINISVTKFKKAQKIKHNEILPEISENYNFLDKMIKDESLNLLLEAIYKLNETDKSIILLYLEEKSYEEISEITGISKSNVGVRINRIKSKLKKYLKN